MFQCGIFCSNKVYGVFDSESLSSFQNAVEVFSFSIYSNSLGTLSDLKTLLINRFPFSAGSINRRFGLKFIMELLFVVVGNFRKLCLGFGLSRFGNLIYQETQISILGEKVIKNWFNLVFQTHGEYGILMNSQL